MKHIKVLCIPELYGKLNQLSPYLELGAILELIGMNKEDTIEIVPLSKDDALHLPYLYYLEQEHLTKIIDEILSDIKAIIRDNQRQYKITADIT